MRGEHDIAPVGADAGRIDAVAVPDAWADEARRVRTGHVLGRPGGDVAQEDLPEVVVVVSGEIRRLAVEDDQVAVRARRRADRVGLGRIAGADPVGGAADERHRPAAEIANVELPVVAVRPRRRLDVGPSALEDDFRAVAADRWRVEEVALIDHGSRAGRPGAAACERGRAGAEIAHIGVRSAARVVAVYRTRALERDLRSVVADRRSGGLSRRLCPQGAVRSID